MNVRELKQDWIDTLKMNIYYNDNPQELCDVLTDADMKIVGEADWWYDIPNEIVYKVYDGIDFVKEDFECD